MKNKSYLETKNKEDCVACGACNQVCAKNAIMMKFDEYGYLYPYINSELCVNCGKCIEACPMGKLIKKQV